MKSNSSLFRLHHLRYLDLFGNNFISSPLPSEFGNLNRLEVLYLTANGFLGQVPSSFNRLGLLSLLDLSLNKLTGSFPLVRNLTKLTILDFSHNQFARTLNPNNSVFELHHLRYLRISYNNFTSSLPSEFGNLNKLEFLSLSSNGFVGQVPSTISNLTRLIELSLDKNKLTGSFPLVENLTDLSALEIYDNHFSGTIPSSLITMPFLYLNLRENFFHGSIEVLNSSATSKLEFMYLGLNHFGKQILEPISKLINLEHLDISFLNTSHPIDLNLLSSLESLSYLNLSGNSISLASLSSNSYIPLNLEILCLSQCGISKFPNIVKNLQELEYIDLSNNRIKGKVPEWLWSLPRLSSVVISNNSFDDFAGSTGILVNSSVKYLDLQQNCFHGTIPNLPLSINILAAMSNKFTGSIPISLCNCRSLTHLVLPYNNLTGPIPKCQSNDELKLSLELNSLKLRGQLQYLGLSIPQRVKETQ